ANNIQVEALADDGLVVAGQPVRVSVIVANHGAADVTVKQVQFGGFDGSASCPMSTLRKEQVGRCEPTLKVRADERLTEPYWHRPDAAGFYPSDDAAPFGQRYRPTPFYVQVTCGMGGTKDAPAEEVIDGLTVQFRYQGNIFSGEKRSELLVVPALSVR